MKIYRKKFLKVFLIIVFATCLAFSFIGFFSAKNLAFAADTDYGTFLPDKSEEYYALISPIHAYSDDEITAVTTNNKKLFIAFGGDTPVEIPFADDLGGQVARFGNYLIYRKSQTMCGIQIDNTDNKPELKYIDSLNNPTTLTCYSHYYYDNGKTKLFAASVENKLRVFTVQTDIDGKPVFVPIQDLIDYPVTINDNSPVTLNGSSIFYINTDGRLCCRKVDAPLQSPSEYLTNIIPTSSMIANDEFVFYVSGTKIYKLNINDDNATPQELSFIDDKYDLGKIDAPKGLSFKGNNLLITDFSDNGSVQEFKINGDTLEFTGYAIASGLTAFNRVAANATNIDRYGKYLAALDGNKLTVIDTENCADYNKNAFVNKFIGSAPDKFALGDGTMLYSKGTVVFITGVTDNNEKPVTGLPTGTPNGITYQSGIYYVAYFDIGTNSKIVKINEKGEVLSETIFTGVAATKIAADVFGNIYVADSDKVYKNEAANAYPLGGVTKLATDLAGTLFALASDGKIYKLDETTGTFTVAVEITGKTIKTFGMDFDRQRIYFLISGEEQVYYTDDAGNVSLENVTPLIAEEYSAALKSKRELSVYTAKEGANMYAVSAENGAFKFNGLIEKAAEYPLIANIAVDNLSMCVLAGESGVVLINANDLQVKTVETAVAPEKAFLTTAVNAYAIPVIEKNGTFIMDKGEGQIQLNKGAVVSVENEFTLLNKAFYSVTANANGEDFACYIPKGFTATVLSENFEFENYSVEKVKTTSLYKTADLTEELFTVTNGETVKVLEQNGGVLKVAVTYQGSTLVGYISENSLIENPSNTVRNILIILALFGSLAGTLSYFLLRKKR